MSSFFQDRNFGRNEEKSNTNRYENLYKSTKKLLNEAIELLEEAIANQPINIEKAKNLIAKVKDDN